MTRDTQPDWGSLLWEARGYLGLDENDPVPVDEILAQAKANGRDEDEAREALRDTDALEAVGDDPDDLRVRAVEGAGEQPAAGDCEDDPDPDTDNAEGAGGAQDAEPRETGENSAENPETRRTTPGVQAAETGSPAGDSGESAGDSSAPVLDEWGAADFATVDPDTYPPALLEREQWMGRLAGEKMPFSPWADRDHPEADPDNDARYKWGLAENYVDGETVAIAEDDPRLGGRIFIQRDPDPFAFVDGDDVRCPETGAVHPAFVEILDRLGATYADVSTSGAGVHAYYRGELPNDQGQAVFDIDTEPWGENDDPPTVEIYANKHVCVATGEHVDGTPDDVHPWDRDAVGGVLEEHDAKKDPAPVAHDTDRDLDLDEYDAGATGRDETTSDPRDIALAVDRLRPRDLPLRTRQVDTDATGWEKWDPSSYRTSSGGDSLHRPPDEPVFHDHKHGESFGVLSLFAAEQGILSKPWGRLAGGDWWEAVDAARDAGAPIPEYEGGRGGGDPDTEGDHRDDPREIDATVDPRRAWDAAGRVTPADLPDDRLATDPDGETFVGPQGGPVDVVRAAALAEDLADADEPLQGDAWRVAYRAARVRYDAPLPRYYTTTDAVAEYEAVVDLIGEVTFWDLDRDALNTEITQEGDEVGGAAVRALNPAWRESESGSSVLVYEPGNVWDADTGSTLDAVRFVALDAGIIDDPSDRVEGSDFTDAYELLRGEYDAPLPRWDYIADGSREVTPQLPPADALLEDTAGVDIDRLAEARRAVEELLGEAVTDAETPTVVRALPATGKTTGTIKTARDTPLSYLAPRLELQKDALETADEYGVDARVLPVLSDRQPRREVLNAAVAHVREQGTDHLRDRWGVLAAAFDGVEDDEDTDDLEPGDIFVDEDDEDTVDLDRATCPTASGGHGPAWALAVHTARALGYRAREIHEDARGLFGAALPCSCEDDEDGDGCPYGEGWKHARDPENTPDLLVGSYGHAHVETVRTAYSRDRDGDLQREPRAVVLDEYPGEAFGEDYGPEALDFATWLARSLRDDVDDRVDMQTADLWGDDWVRAWLDGEAGEADDAVRGAIDTLERAAGLLDAAEAAEHLLDEVDAGALEAVGARAPLEAVGERPAEAYRELAAAVEDPRPQVARLANWIADDVVDPLGEATLWGETAPDTDAVDTAALPASGDLVALVEDALDTAQAGDDGALAALTAAAEALTGGPDGCRRLAAWASDGYAHPDAHHFLKAVAAPSGEPDDPATRIDLDGFAYDPAATEGTVVDHLPTGDRARVLVDRNGHGATLDAPPDRTAGNGEPAPFVGLDATARRGKWREVLHEEVELADIHDTARERRRFLREVLDVRVVQAAECPRSYSGNPATKDTEGDVALLEALAEEYSGVEAPRTRDDAPTTVGSAAVITTKGVRQVLEADSRLDDTVAAWDHYGNVTGDNDLAEHRLAAVLGTQHYGDDAVEKFAALAGETVDTSREDGRGAALDYGSELANEYLAHMREDTTMQAVLRFARGEGGGATVVARTSALREDLPVDAEGQVVETWSDTATEIARRWRALGERFTVADVADAVDVSRRQVRRVLDELDEAGYVDKTETGEGLANEYEGLEQPGAGEAELPDRDEAVASTGEPGHTAYGDIHTWNVRVRGGETAVPPPREPTPARARGAPPAPTAEVARPPDD
jgi:DNA-binding transcriptional ArsR family regulator